MSDRDASISDAAFREALDAAFDRYGDWRTYKGTRGEVYQDFQTARARVLALYDEIVAERDDLMAIAIGDKVRKPSNPSLAERQGEEYGVRRIWVTSRADRMEQQDVVFLNGVKPGDRVWVTKVEEGQ